MDREEFLARNAQALQSRPTTPQGMVPVEGLDEINAAYANESALFGDMWTSLLSGGTGLAASGVGAVEGIADWTGLDTAADALKGVRQKVAESAAEQLEGLSPRGKTAIQKKFLAEDMGDSAFLDYYSLATQFAQTAPSIVISLLPATLAAKVGVVGAAALGGGINAGIVSGDTWAAVADELEDMPETELMESPRYRQLLDQGMEPAEARDALVDEVAGLAAFKSGAVSGLTQMVPTGGLAASRVGKGLNQRALGRAATGAVAEGTQEAIEEGTQAYQEQSAIGSVTGAEVDMGEVAERSVAGAVLGGGMGSVANVALGKRRKGVDADVEQAFGEMGNNQPPPTAPTPAPQAPMQGPPTLEEYAAGQREGVLPLQQPTMPQLAPVQGPPAPYQGPQVQTETAPVSIPDNLRPRPDLGVEGAPLNPMQRDLAARQRMGPEQPPANPMMASIQSRQEAQENPVYGPPVSGAMQRDFDMLDRVEEAMVGATDMESRRVQEQQQLTRQQAEENMRSLATEIIDGVPALQRVQQTIANMEDWQNGLIDSADMKAQLQTVLPAIERLNPGLATRLEVALSTGGTADASMTAVARIFDPNFEAYDDTQDIDTTEAEITAMMKSAEEQRAKTGTVNPYLAEKAAKEVRRRLKGDQTKSRAAASRARRVEGLQREAEDRGLYGKDADEYVRREMLARGIPQNEGRSLPRARVASPDQEVFTDIEDRAERQATGQADSGMGSIVTPADKKTMLSTSKERSRAVLSRFQSEREQEAWDLREESRREELGDMSPKEVRAVYMEMPQNYRQSGKKVPQKKSVLIEGILHFERIQEFERIEKEVGSEQKRRIGDIATETGPAGERTVGASEGKTLEKTKEVVAEAEASSRKKARRASFGPISYDERVVATQRAVDLLQERINKLDREQAETLLSHVVNRDIGKTRRDELKEAKKNEALDAIDGVGARSDVLLNGAVDNANAYAEVVSYGIVEGVTVDPRDDSRPLSDEYENLTVAEMRRAVSALKKAGLTPKDLNISKLDKLMLRRAMRQLGGRLSVALNEMDRQRAVQTEQALNAALESTHTFGEKKSDKAGKARAAQPPKGMVGPPTKEEYQTRWYEYNKRRQPGTQRLAREITRLRKAEAKLLSAVRGFEKVDNTSSDNYKRKKKALEGVQAKLARDRKSLAKLQDEATTLAQEVRFIEDFYAEHNLNPLPLVEKSEVTVPFEFGTVGEVRTLVLRALGSEMEADLYNILNANNTEQLQKRLDWLADKPEAVRRVVLQTVSKTVGLPTVGKTQSMANNLLALVAENGRLSADASVGSYKLVYQDSTGAIKVVDGGQADALAARGVRFYQMPPNFEQLSAKNRRVAYAALEGGPGQKSGQALLDGVAMETSPRPLRGKQESKPKPKDTAGDSPRNAQAVIDDLRFTQRYAEGNELTPDARARLEAERTEKQRTAHFKKLATEGMSFAEAKQAIQEFYGPDETVDRILMQMETRGLRVRILPGTEIDGYAGRFTQSTSGFFITLDPAKADPKTLLHELVHAYTAQNVATDPDLNRVMTRLMIDAQKQAVNIGKEKMYGFRNVQEFVAEAFSNRDFQAVLGAMKPMRRPTLWKRFVRGIGKLFGFKADAMPETKLAAILEMEDALFAIPDNKKKLVDLTLNDMAKTSHVVSSTMQQTSEALTGTDPGTLNRAVGFRVLTRAQFARVFDRMFAYEGGNPLRDYTEALEKRSAAVHKHVSQGESILRDWGLFEDEASKADLEAFREVVGISQVYNLDPRPGKENPKQTNQEALRRGQAAWQKLSPKGREVFNRATYFGEQEYKKTARMLVSNVLDALGLNLTYEDIKAAGTKKGDLDKALRNAGVEAADVDRVREALSGIVFRPKVDGPYIPLRRFGKWVVDYSGGWTQENMTPEQIDNIVGSNPAIKVRSRSKNDSGTYDVEFSARIVSFAETKTEIEQKQAELDQEWADLKKQFPQMEDLEGTVPGGIGTKEEMRMPPNESASRLMEIIRAKAAKDESLGSAALKQIELAFISLLPATSIQQAELRRKGVKGFSTEFRRAFAEHYRASAYYLAQLEHGRDGAKGLRRLSTLARDAQKKRDPNAARMGQVVAELRRRDDQYSSLATSPWMIDKISEFGFFTYLVSPSYWFVNATQPFLTTLPVLGAKYGNANAGRSMKRALEIVAPQTASLAWKEMLGFKLARGSQSSRSEALNRVGATIKDRIKQENDPDLEYVIQQLEDRGLIDLTFSLETREAAEGEAKTMMGKVWQKTMDMGRYMPHTIEVNNRMMAGIATYYAAKKRVQKKHTDAGLKGDALKEAVRKELADIVADTVDMTQFNYSAENKAPLMRNDGLFGPLSRPLMMFKQYAQHMYFLLAYNARQAFKGETKEERRAAYHVVRNVLGAHTAAGGALGGLMIEPIRWALGLVGMAFNDPDDPDEFWDDIDGYMMRNYGNSLAGEMLLKGGFRPLGIDLSQRVGLDNMLFMDIPPAQRPEQEVTNFMVSMLGPIAAVGVNYGKAYGQFESGDLTGGMISTLPKGFRDMVKAGRLANTGMVDSRGKVIYPSNEFDPVDVFIQAMGLSPTEVARVYENRGAVYSAKGKLDARKSELRSRYYNAGSMADRMRVLREVREFNRANPLAAITPASLRQGLEQRKETERRSSRSGGAPIGSDSEEWLAREFGVN